MQELFLEAFDIEKFYEIASSEERKALHELEEKIRNTDKKIHILASVETWCPYARVFVATLRKIHSLNSNFELGFITMGKGLVKLADELKIEEDDFVIPTAVILNDSYDIISTFIGYPKKYEKGLGELKKSYYNGNMADEIVEEIINNIN